VECDELFTVACLLEQVQDFPEAARYYYAMAAEKKTLDEERQGLAGLARLLLSAPEQPFASAQAILHSTKLATMDRGPDTSTASCRFFSIRSNLRHSIPPKISCGSLLSQGQGSGNCC